MKYGILVVLALLAIVSVASAALPATVSVSKITVPNGPISYFEVTTTTAGGDLSPAGLWESMCVGYTIHGVKTGIFKVYDSTNPVGLPLYINTVDWHKINWMAQPANRAGVDWRIVQAAIWKLDGASGVAYPADAYTNGYNHADFDAFMALVNAQGAFVPGPTDYYVAILTMDDANGNPISQPILIPVKPIPTNTPEFPSLALPVALLVGIVGAVEFIRTKKE
jgi:hypothetical protein